MTELDTLDLLQRLQDFYDEPYDEARTNRWVRALADANPQDIEAAARGYMTDEPRWFPKPAQLLAMVRDRPGSHVPTSRKPTKPFPGYLIPDGGGFWMVPKDGPIPPRVLHLLDAART